MLSCAAARLQLSAARSHGCQSARALKCVRHQGTRRIFKTQSSAKRHAHKHLWCCHREAGPSDARSSLAACNCIAVWLRVPLTRVATARAASTARSPYAAAGGCLIDSVHLRGADSVCGRSFSLHGRVVLPSYTTQPVSTLATSQWYKVYGESDDNSLSQCHNCGSAIAHLQS